jgi:hypothetical protein
MYRDWCDAGLANIYFLMISGFQVSTPATTAIEIVLSPFHEYAQTHTPIGYVMGFLC